MGEIRTLIVDDSSVMRKIVERALRQAGLNLLVVHEAGSGTEGLDLLRTEAVDLILSDINMPAMDGLWSSCARFACRISLLECLL
jgi:two-component system chemotaxis response regulator CheY